MLSSALQELKGLRLSNFLFLSVAGIVNAIGVSNDTESRKDSVVYSEYTETDHHSEMDWLILRILYSDEIKCGMNEDECYEAIKKIYY